MSLYLKQYFSDMESLPAELRRKFIRMRELDTRVQKLKKKIDQRSDPYLKNLHILSPEEKEFHIKRIENLYKKAKEYIDSKNQLAIESYDLVDKLICRMDSDLEGLTAGIPVGEESKPAEPNKNTKAKKQEKGKNKRKMDSSDEGSDVDGRKNKKKKQLCTNAGASSTSAAEGKDDAHAHPPALIAANHQNLYNMPVDPNEPAYCFCRQVSYGEMVACDNPACTIEWFHFPCVGLITEPEGDWYCPNCTAERKLKKPKIVKYICPECFEELNGSGQVKF